jgi:hypothetical protein
MYNIEQEWLANRSRSRVDTHVAYQATEQSFLVAPAKATFRDNYALMMDISMYQPVVNWTEFKEYFSFAIARSSFGAIGPNYGGFVDKEFALNHVQKAYDNDVPIGAYHVLDPGYYMYKLETLGYLKDADNHLPADKDEQWQTFVKAITNKKIYAIAVDFELYKDWNGNKMSSIWLLEVINRWMTLMLRYYGTKYPILFYSGKWFVDNYCPEIVSTAMLAKFGDLWTAYYPYAAGVVNLADGDDLKANYPPESMTYDNSVHQNPPFLGWPGWKFWQFSGDKFTLPWVTNGVGSPSALDLNFFNGTKEQLYDYIKFIPSGPVTHTCPTGQHWEDASQSCVADPVTPPVDDELVKRVTALETDFSDLQHKIDGINSRLDNATLNI